MTEPITVEEVNGRTGFEIKGKMTGTAELLVYHVYTLSGTTYMHMQTHL